MAGIAVREHSIGLLRAGIEIAGPVLGRALGGSVRVGILL